jgi:hypothetical protein
MQLILLNGRMELTPLEQVFGQGLQDVETYLWLKFHDDCRSQNIGTTHFGMEAASDDSVI